MVARTRRALTLLEVLLVVSLLGVLAAFVWPDFDAARRSEQLDESVRRCRTLVAMCRAEAMLGAQRYRVVFRPDGTLKVETELDPLAQPEVYKPVPAEWARSQLLLEDVWVESLVPLPDGPPPVQVEDELIEFEELAETFEPIRIEEFELPLVLEFRPDGTCDSLRWTLRDARGRGAQLTLDGRLGRLAVLPVEPVPEGSLERPAPIAEEDQPSPDGSRTGVTP